jgi:hypothetical protein
VVEVHGIDRAIHASAHEGRRRLCRGGMFGGSHHVELLVMVVLLRPLIVAWGLHDGRIRGGLISCWRRRAAIASALSRISVAGWLAEGVASLRCFGVRRVGRGECLAGWAEEWW